MTCIQTFMGLAIISHRHAQYLIDQTLLYSIVTCPFAFHRILCAKILILKTSINIATIFTKWTVMFCFILFGAAC